MKYYIRRGLNEYGPYTLADLQRYVAQGNIAMTDLTRSEGMTDWVPVSQVIGNIPVPVPSPVAPVGSGAVYAGTPGAGVSYGAVPAYGTAARVGMMTGPIPPDFHWALVLLIGFFCGIFQLIWVLIEASFVRKIRPGNRGTFFLVVGMVVQFLAFVPLFVSAAQAAAQNRDSFDTGALSLFWLLLLGGFVLDRIGVFQMRAGLLEYYNTVEPINLRLSSVMTFFFAVWYFQYHFTRIATWKKTGYLEAQQ